MPRTTVTAGDQYVDSRDIIRRIEELEEGFIDYTNDQIKDVDDWATSIDDPRVQETMKNSDDQSDQEELAALKELASQAEGYGDWDHGETLILEEYFHEYIKQLVEDTSDVDLKNLPSYIADNINWEGVADDMKADYTEVTWHGYTYFMRA